VVGGSFQGVDRVRFHVHREEVNPELLFKVPPGLYGENASVRFLMKDVLRPLGSTTTLEKHESPKNFFLFITELFWDYVRDVWSGSGVTWIGTELLRSGRELTTKVGEQPWPQLVRCASIYCRTCGCVFQED